MRKVARGRFWPLGICGAAHSRRASRPSRTKELIHATQRSQPAQRHASTLLSSQLLSCKQFRPRHAVASRGATETGRLKRIPRPTTQQ